MAETHNLKPDPEMVKALPMMLQLLNNPSFVKHARGQGYEFDIQSIWRAYVSTLTYTPTLPIKTTGIQSVKRTKPRLTASDFVMLREMGIRL